MRGESRVVIGVIGPEEVIREKPLAAIPGVESVVPVMKPYRLVAQENGAAAAAGRDRRSKNRQRPTHRAHLRPVLGRRQGANDFHRDSW